MPRRGNVPKRDVLPDPMYNSKVVSKLINQIMLDGKKVYEADVTTTSGNATVTFDVTAGVDISHGADIYYNDTYISTKEVK